MGLFSKLVGLGRSNQQPTPHKAAYLYFNGKICLVGSVKWLDLIESAPGEPFHRFTPETEVATIGTHILECVRSSKTQADSACLDECRRKFFAFASVKGYRELEIGYNHLQIYELESGLSIYAFRKSSIGGYTGQEEVISCVEDAFELGKIVQDLWLRSDLSVLEEDDGEPSHT